MTAICGCRSGHTCDCCSGVAVSTPVPIANRPGLDALSYRVGTHATFLATMKARLSGSADPALPGLTTRATDDPSIALLDAWAVVADVLTFYQERIANEGYLRTATERRSILELTRLIGYTLRPGVAASTFLAYTIEKDHRLEIPAGARAQSVPAPGELPQTFETTQPLVARDVWNSLQVRLTRPQNPKPSELASGKALYFKGIATDLKVNDALLVRFTRDSAAVYRVKKVDVEAEAVRTRVEVGLWGPGADFKPVGSGGSGPGAPIVSSSAPELADILGPLGRQPSGPRPALSRGVGDAFAQDSDAIPRVLTALHPELASNLYTAWADVPVTPAPAVEVCVFRTKAAVFGHNAPLRVEARGGQVSFHEWDLFQRDHSGRDVFFAFGIEMSIDAAGVKPPQLVVRFNLENNFLQVPQQSIQQGQTFSVPIPQASPPGEIIDTIDISVLQLSPDTLLPSSLSFFFVKNKILIEIHLSEKGEFDLFTPGLDLRKGGELSISKTSVRVDASGTLPNFDAQYTEEPDVVWLDAPYPQVLPGSFIVLQRPAPLPRTRTPFVLACIQEVGLRSRSDYGTSAKSTRVKLDKAWLDFRVDARREDFSVIRRTAVFAQCERLELAEEPIDPIVDDVCSDTIDPATRKRMGPRLELAGLFDGLEPGRPLIVSGERTDVKAGTSADPVRIAGVPAQELVLLAGVEQSFNENLPGDRTHTTLILAKDLTYCYRRDTVKVFANVVPANHGETRTEVLGSGDATRPQQTFPLRQKPLTFVAAPTPSGIESTLRVRANDILWHEAESFTDAGPTDRVYVTHTDDAGTTAVTFGDGLHGARLPTGSENVRATYRVGIGKGANLGAGRISQAMDRPLGVKDVINPLPATGGADPESRDQARRNAPLAVTALDRLVGLQDYADFARTFAGIGKAEAVRLSDGFREVVVVTIAGIDDIPIDPTAELFGNLEAALRRFGDPHQPLRLLIREALLLVVAAQVRIDPDFLFEKVEPQIRAAMADVFGFDHRELGQDVQLSEVISTIQRVPGVDHVDVDLLRGFSGGLKEIQDAAAAISTSGGGVPAPRFVARSARTDEKHRTVFLPAQLAYFNPGAPDTLILQERKP